MPYSKNLFRSLVLLVAAFVTFRSEAQTYGWQEPANTGLSTFINRAEDIYFVDTNIGYAVCYEGPVLKTTDGANSWNICPLNIAGFRCIELTDDGAVGIIGLIDGGQPYRTTDHGQTWQNVTLPDTGQNNAKKMCGVTHLSNTFFGVGWWGATTARFYKSTDTGATWSIHYMDTGLATGLVDVVFLSQDTGFVTGCKNTTGNIYASNESVVLKTTDGGNTWTKVFSDTTIGGRIWKIQFLNHLVGFASIEPYYDPDTVNIIKTTDGGNTWTMIHAGSIHNTTTPSQPVGTQGVGFATEQKGWIGGYYNGMFETTNGGASWDTISFGSNLNRFQVLDSTHVFVGGYRIYKWTDSISHVDTTVDTTTSIPHLANTTNKLYPIVPNPSNGRLKIEYDLKYETNVVLEIANIDIRRHVQVLNKRLKPGHYVSDWDASNMPSGNYIIWMGTDEIPLVQKFTIRK